MRIFTSILSIALSAVCCLAAIPQKEQVKMRSHKWEATQTGAQKVAEDFKRVKHFSKVTPAFAPTEDESDIIVKEVINEDFSLFTAGADGAPDTNRLDDAETAAIDDKYFNTPGWFGFDVYQAGGAAYLGMNEETYETGMLITPQSDFSGYVTITMRAKSVDSNGDWLDFNLVSVDMGMEVLYGDFFYIGSDWTDVEFTTPNGINNAHIYLFAETYGVYIDDLKISTQVLPTPTLLDETNITENSFTANWTEVRGTEYYELDVYAHHKAEKAETYNLFATNFDKIESTGTEESPEVLDDWDSYMLNDYTDYTGWFVYLPVMIDGAFGVSGRYTYDYEMGFIASPDYDLSHNDGKVTIKGKFYGESGEKAVLTLYSVMEDGYWDVADTKAIDFEGGWTNVEMELVGGSTQSSLEITYVGYNNMLIDDLVVSQNLAEGDEMLLPIKIYEPVETSQKVDVAELFLNDKICYRLCGFKNIYFYDEEYDEYWLTGALMSDYTDVRYVTLAPAGVEGINANSEVSVYFSNNQLQVVGADNAQVEVYAINGTRLSADTAFEKGVYIVKVGNNVVKTINSGK